MVFVEAHCFKTQNIWRTLKTRKRVVADLGKAEEPLKDCVPRNSELVRRHS